ncbi:hypothetical protein J3R03_001386 [Actinoplanes couchii]|nr:hypothetical protein [Actinoplanes couchii]
MSRLSQTDEPPEPYKMSRSKRTVSFSGQPQA